MASSDVHVSEAHKQGRIIGYWLAVPFLKGSALLARCGLGIVAISLLLAPFGVQGQAGVAVIRLPNPDGRDPVFSESRAGAPIVIEFLHPGSGKAYSLRDFPAKLRIVNFWATWCVPCLRELPSLSEISGRYPESAVQILAVSLDRAEVSEIEAFLTGIDVAGLQWFVDSSRQSGQAAEVIVLPTTVLIDDTGSELGRIVGSADWSSPEARQLIDTLLSRSLE